MSKAEDFIEENTKDCSNIFEGYYPNRKQAYYPWIHPKQAREAVEIAKEEIIERVCDYLDGLIELLNDRGHGLKKERIIGGLKQAMKDE